MADFIHQLG